MVIVDFALEKYPFIVATGVTLIVYFVVKRFADSLVTKMGAKSEFPKARTQLVKKYIDVLLAALLLLVLISIWGVKPDQIFLFISSILTVVGVGFFAQWSILSNVTAGIILFFSFPYRIRVMDKDFPIEAEIKDISSFYTLLKTDSGAQISIPNNLLLQKAIEIIK